MSVETVNDVRASFVAEMAAEIAGETVEQPATEKIPEGENPEDNSEGPETATDAEATEETVETEEEGEPETPAIAPPHFWTKEEKEKFSTLPPEVQEFVKARADADERYINQQKQDAAEARKAAVKEAEQFTEISKRIASAAKTAETRFADRWDGADPQWWAKLATEDPNQYTTLKAQYDADQYAKEQATAAREATERVERERWVSEEGERLKSLVPQLFTPEGKKVGEDLKGYLIQGGASEQDLSDLSAVAWQMAYKAMMYDRAQSAKPVQKKSTATALPSRSAPPARATVQQAERKAVEKRVDDATGRGRREAMAELLIQDGYA